MIFVSIISSLCWASFQQRDGYSNVLTKLYPGFMLKQWQKSRYAAHRTDVRIKEVNLKLTMTPKSILKLTSNKINVEVDFQRNQNQVDFQQNQTWSWLPTNRQSVSASGGGGLQRATQFTAGWLWIVGQLSQQSLWSWWWGWPSWYLSKN